MGESVIPNLNNLPVGKNDAVVADHDILNIRRHLRKNAGREEIVREDGNAIHTDMVFGACESDDIKLTGAESACAEVLIAVSWGN